MKKRSIVLTCLVLIAFTAAAALGDWMKVDPAPDVDKANPNSDLSCWLATAANMLAGAGYGDGATMQERAEDIYGELVAQYGLNNGGWTDTALTWWLNSSHNTWPGNPYDIVTVYGNKSKVPWSNSNGARFIGNELRRCQMMGLSISWPRNTSSGSPGGGHAIACWGDSGTQAMLSGNPAQVRVVDSDRDNGGDVQVYGYDSYTNPNPGRFNEGNGWYLNYSNNHPFIKHIITLCPVDNPADHSQTQKVVGSYRIHQSNREVRATDLHYNVGTDVDILSYKTTINWNTDNPPQIQEDNNPPRNLQVDWDLTDNPVPYCTWVTITTEFVVPFWNAISYSNVRFTYPQFVGPIMPMFRWEIQTQRLKETDIPNISGGYVVGSFDLIDVQTSDQPTVIGEYRFMHEYDFNQNPEFHLFQLQSLEPMGYYVGNFKFGHSYGYLDPESLWDYNEWITRLPAVQSLDQAMSFTLDWAGQLPYPQGEIYQNNFEPLLCTEYHEGDLNKDCCVNFADFTIFAEDWLQCTYNYILLK